jgi:hypothetical protein
MDETWLNALKSDPSAQFSDGLRERLAAEHVRERRALGSLLRVLPMAAGVAVVAALFTVPAVRASAASLLARFRVVNFVAVPVEPNRFDALQAKQFDLKSLIGENVQVLQGSDAPVPVASVEQAAALAGMEVQLPQLLPPNTQIVETAVSGELVVRVTANSARLEQVLEALSINDVHVPAGLAGQSVTIQVPPVVMVRFDHGGRRSRLFQAHSPEITLPENVDLAALGEIGLRILGLPVDEARQFAGSIDWRTTLVLPLPPTARSFRQVAIGEHRGVAVEHQPAGQSRTNTVLWTTGDRVFGLTSLQEMEQVLAMANSVR